MKEIKDIEVARKEGKKGMFHFRNKKDVLQIKNELIVEKKKEKVISKDIDVLEDELKKEQEKR